MKIFTCLITLLLIQFNILAQQEINATLQYDGIERSYILYLPPNYDIDNNFPLVLNYHGYGSTAFQQKLYSKMNNLAENEGFIVCYPEGIDNQWNAGFSLDTDDVGFTNALIDELLANYKIDEKRVYSTGMSNGGYFSYQLACELSDRIAAIASVTGSMVPNALANCNPSRNMPIMQIHGTTDPTVNYNGSTIATPIEDLVDYWANFNGCDSAPNIIEIEDVNTEDNCNSERWEFENCNESKQVIFYKIYNGGHTWPGSPALPGFGNTCQDFNATEVIWNFFKQYNLDGFTSFDETNLQNINVYPNPCTNFITIKGLNKSTSFQVYDITGKLIIDNITQLNALINVEMLTQGVYLLHLPEHNISTKLSKLH